jgi:hypothetical protein
MTALARATSSCKLQIQRMLYENNESKYSVEKKSAGLSLKGLDAKTN